MRGTLSRSQTGQPVCSHFQLKVLYVFQICSVGGLLSQWHAEGLRLIIALIFVVNLFMCVDVCLSGRILLSKQADA